MAASSEPSSQNLGSEAGAAGKRRKSSASEFLEYWGKKDVFNLGSLGSIAGTVDRESDLDRPVPVLLRGNGMECGRNVIPE